VTEEEPEVENDDGNDVITDVHDERCSKAGVSQDHDDVFDETKRSEGEEGNFIIFGSFFNSFFQI